MSETAITIPAPPEAANAHRVHWWHKQTGFSFHDILDTINPLQHIPIVSTIYRSATHDEPGAVARILGDGLFGGGPIGALIGLFTGALNVLVQADTGKDIGEHVMALVGFRGSRGATTRTGVADSGSAAASERPPMPLSPSRYVLPRAPASRESTGSSRAPSATEWTTDAIASAAPSLSAAPVPPGGPSILQRPVPLRLTGMALPGAHPRPVPATPANPAPSAPPASGSAAAVGAAPPPSQTAAAPPTGAPVEISEKMSEALDRYTRMMQRQHKPAAGSQINVVQ